MKRFLPSTSPAARPQDPALREHALRALVERRCDLYVRAAGLLMDIEESLDKDDPERARFAFDELRRALRSALAFLTDDVYRALVEVEALVASGASVLEARPGLPAREEELRDRLALLHVRLARMLDLPAPDVADVIGLSARLREKLALDSAATERRAERARVEERLRTDADGAREMIAAKQYKKALRHLRRAVRVDPERAVLRNDLGVVFGLMGCHEQAVEAYREAVALNERFPDRRTDEWTTSWRNLGIALGRLAAEEEDSTSTVRALGHAREALRAFETFLELTPDGPRLAEARSLARRAEEEVRFLEERAAAEKAREEVEASTPPGASWGDSE